MVFSVEHCLERWELANQSSNRASTKNYHRKKFNQLISVNGFFKVMFEGIYD